MVKTFKLVGGGCRPDLNTTNKVEHTTTTLTSFPIVVYSYKPSTFHVFPCNTTEILFSSTLVTASTHERDNIFIKINYIGDS